MTFQNLQYMHSILGLIPSIDVYFVHLVRDVRAVAFSYSKKKEIGDKNIPVRLSVHSPIFTSYLWIAWNIIAEFLGVAHILEYKRI